MSAGDAVNSLLDQYQAKLGNVAPKAVGIQVGSPQSLLFRPDQLIGRLPVQSLVGTGQSASTALGLGAVADLLFIL